MKKTAIKHLRHFFLSFFVVFALFALTITASFLIFFSYIHPDKESVDLAAPVTFFNVLVMSGLFSGIHMVWRHFTVTRPIRRIQAALKTITDGDFSCRLNEKSVYGNFTSIVDSINTMAEELQSVEVLKADFITSITHELKTPLAVIQNYGQLLQTKELSDEKRLLWARGVTENAHRMNGLITNILRLNQLESQRIAPQRETFDLSSQLIDCVLQFEPLWEEKQIEVSADICDDVTLKSYKELIGLIWNNLLSNAFKFTPPGGKVNVALAADPGVIRVTVSDTGCGMDENTVKHIFEKYYQGDTLQASQGNGLGLALVKKVLGLAGGTIEVESEAEKGSSFTVTLPRGEAAETMHLQSD